jgi:DNA-binding NtrC family response regulator
MQCYDTEEEARKVKALIVEDNRSVRSLLKDILSRMRLDVVEAECDEEVINNLVYTEGIGIAVIDATSKGVQCREACELIKKHWPYVRLIVTSEDMSAPEEEVFSNLGVGAFLKKPYELSEVREAMGRVLNHFNLPEYE